MKSQKEEFIGQFSKAVMEPVHDYVTGTWTQEDEDKLNQNTINFSALRQSQDAKLLTSASGGFSKGLKYDNDKPRMDLLDAEFLEGVAKVLTFGARKYAAHNWRGGISYSRLLASTYRHLGAINRGEDIDPESGLSHIHHVGCNAMFLSWMMQHKPELDDRYKESK